MSSFSVTTICRLEHNKLKQRHDEDLNPCHHMQASFLISWPAMTQIINKDPGSFHYPTSLSISWPTMTYLIKNRSYQLIVEIQKTSVSTHLVFVLFPVSLSCKLSLQTQWFSTSHIFTCLSMQWRPPYPCEWHHNPWPMTYWPCWSVSEAIICIVSILSTGMLSFFDCSPTNSSFLQSKKYSE